jgi:hypothetical protein
MQNFDDLMILAQKIVRLVFLRSISTVCALFRRKKKKLNKITAIILFRDLLRGLKILFFNIETHFQ